VVVVVGGTVVVGVAVVEVVLAGAVVVVVGPDGAYVPSGGAWSSFSSEYLVLSSCTSTLSPTAVMLPIDAMKRAESTGAYSTPLAPSSFLISWVIQRYMVCNPVGYTP
jgi:hypothetical protein